MKTIHEVVVLVPPLGLQESSSRSALMMSFSTFYHLFMYEATRSSTKERLVQTQPDATVLESFYLLA